MLEEDIGLVIKRATISDSYFDFEYLCIRNIL